MAGIFDEENMLRVLGECVPEGETLSAAVHGVTLQVNRKKTSRFDVYVGVTERCMVVAECEYSSVDGILVLWQHLVLAYRIQGQTYVPFSEIERCELKNAVFGAVNCSVTLKNGDFLKLQLPKLGGVSGGMPHHTEYREAILARLCALAE